MQSSTGSSWLVPLRLEGGNPHVRLSGGSHFLFSKWGKKTCLLRHQEKARHEETYICRAQIKFSVLKVFSTEEFCDKHNLSFLSVANCGNLACVGCTESSLLHACSLWLQGAAAALQPQRVGFSSQWLCLLQSLGFRHAGFSSWGMQAQQLRHTALVASRHVGSSRTRDRTRRPCNWYAYSYPLYHQGSPDRGNCCENVSVLLTK